MNILCKVYKKGKKLKNDNKQANMSSMQTAEKNKYSVAMDPLY